MKYFYAAALLLFAGCSAFAEERTKTAIGFTFDCMPTALSAASGKFGYSYQTWIGVDHVRFRLVGAQIYMPEKLTSSQSFDRHSMTVSAAILDYMFGDRFDGAWVGSGLELWQNRIRSKSTGEVCEWTNQVLTAGAGYSFLVAGNCFVEPWGAVHYIMNQRSVSSGSSSFAPQRLSAEVSLKVGYFFTK